MRLDDALMISKGNREAAVFLCDWDAFCGVLDDVIDEPGKVSDVRLVNTMLGLLATLCNEGWGRTNAPRLFPLMVAGANAWLDANRLATGTDTREKLASDVLKSSYREMERAVAYLCGGFTHMHNVCKREFDWDLTPATPLEVSNGLRQQ